jgi:hypothetical protein
MGSHDGSNGTPLDPPLFWLDNIFNPIVFILNAICYFVKRFEIVLHVIITLNEK